MRYWLDESLVLRLGRESALAFRRRDGLRVRLNPSGGRYLAALHGRTPAEAWSEFRERFPGAPAGPDAGAQQVLEHSFRLGLLRPKEQPPPHLIEHGEPAPPEVVHLLITDRCNYRCPSCYAANAGTAHQLTLDELKGLADELAALGVLELAIGGGEPLLRSDLEELVAHASRQMVVNVTTNGSRLDLERAHRLKEAGINLVQISVNGPDETINGLSRQRGTFNDACEALTTLDLAGVRSGVNLVVTRELRGRLAETIAFFARFNPHQFILIRPKPSAADDPWFAAHGLPASAFPALADEVQALPRQFPGQLITVDSTFGPLFQNISPEHLESHGFRGLAGGRTSCCIDADGSVYPGSHFIQPKFLAGNIREQPLAEIWEQAPIMARFRALPKKLEGACQECNLLDICNGGCRKTAFIESGDINQGDRYCVQATAY